MTVVVMVYLSMNFRNYTKCNVSKFPTYSVGKNHLPIIIMKIHAYAQYTITFLYITTMNRGVFLQLF